MAENVSNRNGRALEFKIIDSLVSKESKFNVTLTHRAEKDQDRDLQNFELLPDTLKESYVKCSNIVCKWLESLLGEDEIVLDRLSDADAKLGDVTDIRLTVSKRVLNLSIKHNHSALKHQRPPTTAKHCGYSKGSPEDVEFRQKLSKILEVFQDKAKKLIPGVKLFNELDKKELKFIDNNLYKPVCELVCNTINNLCKDDKHTQHLFSFLVGICSFYKIIDYPDYVKILNFCKIGLPNNVQATLVNNSYISLLFDNGWEINMRLHTAESEFGNSLKFDSQPVKIPKVEEIIIKK